MKIYIRMFGRFRQQFGEEREIEMADPITPLDALKMIGATSPDAYSALFDDHDDIRRHIVLMVNKKRISHGDCNVLLLGDADKLGVLPPVAGG